MVFSCFYTDGTSTHCRISLSCVWIPVADNLSFKQKKEEGWGGGETKCQFGECAKVSYLPKQARRLYLTMLQLSQLSERFLWF